MALDPGVRLIAEGSGALIGHLPQYAPVLSTNDEVVYGPAGGTAVTYKIEKVRYVTEYSIVGNPEAVDRYSVYGRTDLIVSVVVPVP